MTRLTKASRDKIIEALIDQRFAEEHARLVAERAALAADIYESWAKLQPIHPDKLPKGWLPTRSRVTVQIAGETVQLNFSGVLTGWAHGSNERRFPSERAGGILATFGAESPFKARWDKHDIAVQTYNAARDIAHAATKSAVNRFNTLEALIEAWPECKPFVTIPDTKPPKLLPVVQVEELNAILGLKPATEETPNV